MNNPLQQYIDLYTGNPDMVQGNPGGALNQARDKTLERLLEERRLPDRSDEGYAKTSVAEMFAPDYGINLQRHPVTVDLASSFHCGVPNLSTLMAVVAVDRFAPTRTLQQNLPQGVVVCSLAEGVRRYPGIADRYYNSLASRRGNAATDLNTLFAQDGVMIYVPDGVRLEKAIQIVQLFQGDSPRLAFRRILLVAGKDSRVAVLKCDHSHPDSADFLSSEVIEVIASEGSEVQFYDLEESAAATRRMSQMFARQDAGSKLTVAAATLFNGTTRNEFRIDCTGDHTATRLSGMAIGSRSQHIDNSSEVVHRGQHGHSDQLFKYVLDDEARGAFEGSIEVAEGSRFVEAYQSNRNVLASTGARMHTKPQLLIYNDDVKCSHGATTGQLDDRALFYMQTRGIPLDEARRMLMQAFMVDVVDTIALEPLRDRLRHMVERRFASADHLCDASCRQAE